MLGTTINVKSQFARNISRLNKVQIRSMEYKRHKNKMRAEDPRGLNGKHSCFSPSLLVIALPQDPLYIKILTILVFCWLTLIKFSTFENYGTLTAKRLVGRLGGRRR